MMFRSSDLRGNRRATIDWGFDEFVEITFEKGMEVESGLRSKIGM